jgi:beta-lactamase class A
MQSRRLFMGSTAALSIAQVTPAASAKRTTISADKIVSLFQPLPGVTAVKILAPATGKKPQLRISSNASTQLFVGSAFKTFVLAEALRQADRPDIIRTISTPQLTLDASVWSVDSATFNPPNLTGTVSQRTALEAMIMHSDNTATDMCLKQAGPDKVRNFITSAGLRKTAIPDSTRSFFGYLLGAPDYKTFTWAELQASGPHPFVNPPLNSVETLASSADDLVSYYSRALQGEFFKESATLTEFRRILSLGDAIWRLPVPLGARACAKGGSIDIPGFHCVCVAGGMFFDGRWVYFTFIVNWDAAAETDPDTVVAFVNASGQALALVFDALSA